MRVDGTCHCGAIRFEAEADPARVSICHCTDCQALTGTAFRLTVPVPDANFRLIAGAPKVYTKMADSGAKREQAFCAECGSPIYATSVGPSPKTLGVRVGTLSQRAELPPQKQIWHASALPWAAEALAGIPASEKDK